MRALQLGFEDRHVTAPLIGGLGLARMLTTATAILSSKGQE